MLNKLTSISNRVMQRYLPDPYLFVVLLTFVVFILGILMVGNSPMEMVQYWGDGFWAFLAFSMEMVLILVTGFVLASSPIFKKLLIAIAKLAKTPGQAIIYVTVVSIIASLLSWGFGLVIGALFAKELARRVEKVDYRLLIASAYSGFIVWHGLSGSIPLKIATDGHFMQDMIGIIPTSETLFSAYNLFIIAALFVVLPIVNRLMMNSKENAYYIDPNLLKDENVEAATIETEDMTPAQKLENSWLISVLTFIMGFTFIVYYFIQNGFSLNIDFVIFMFLFFGILLHWTPRRFINSVKEAVKGASGIIIQFPFYAGIMGMMIASGLATEMSNWFVSISTDFTFPLFAFLSAGLVNFFVPSGGGQWGVQAPVMMEAAQAMNYDYAKAAMAVAWGDAWTNMIQPFWALPALAIAKLNAKDIMGYCLIVLFVSGVIISIGLLFF